MIEGVKQVGRFLARVRRIPLAIRVLIGAIRVSIGAMRAGRYQIGDKGP